MKKPSSTHSWYAWGSQDYQVFCIPGAFTIWWTLLKKKDKNYKYN